jgi:gas vesicle protein
MEDDKRFSYFFLGLGIGVAAGILFAPKAGSETREFLRAKTGEGADYLKRRSQELRDNASDLVDRGRDAVVRQKEQFGAALDAGRQAYREATARPAPAAPTPDDVIEGV